MAGSIICGIDDSEAARGAARVARTLSSKLGVVTGAVALERVVERAVAARQRVRRLVHEPAG